MTRTVANRCHYPRTRRKRWRGCHWLLASQCVLLLTACDQQADPLPAASTTATAHDITITLALSGTDLTTVDRTTLTVDLTFPPDTLPAFTPPISDALQSAGWIVVSSETAEPRLASPHAAEPTKHDTDRLLRRTRVTIEPSLPGDLPIPALTATLPNGDAVTTDPLPVTIATLLPEDDALADSPELTEERDTPPEPEPSSTRMIVIGVTAVIIFAGVVIIGLAGRKPKGPDPRAELRRLAREARRLADRDNLNQQDIDTLDHALREAIRLAAEREADHAELLARLERARFAPLPPPPEAAHDLAEHTAAAIRTMQDNHARRIGEPDGAPPGASA